MVDKKYRFGTSGIRGYTNTEISPELALSVGRAFARYLNVRGRMVVGYDTRWGAGMLAKAAAMGMVSEGMAVTDLGQVPTPAFATYLVDHGFNGGIMITGSHMPPERIGIIVMLDDGAYAQDEVAAAIEGLMYEPGPDIVPPHPRTIGSYTVATGAPAYYLQRVTDFVDTAAIRKRKFKVLVDPGNGTACGLMVRLLEQLGCQTIEVNHHPQPVPNREAEPRARNLGPTAGVVVANGFDIGVATDVDADRVLFITADGDVISEDVIGALFATQTFTDCDAGSEDRICVTPVNSSGLIEAVCEDLGVPVEYCRIGQPDTARALKQFKSQYSYEESGKYYFATEVLWADAFLATLKLLELMQTTGETLSELVAPFPVFTQVKRTLTCDDAHKAAIMDAVAVEWKETMTEKRAKDVTIDGLKRVYTDSAWLLIRASGTEPLIRVYSDARTQDRAEQLVNDGLALVQGVIDEIQGQAE